MKASEIRQLIKDTEKQQKYDSRKEVEDILDQIIKCVKKYPFVTYMEIPEIRISLHAKEILTLPESEGGYGYTIEYRQTGVNEYSYFISW